MVSFIVYAYRENSGQTVWMHRPTRVSPVRICRKVSFLFFLHFSNDYLYLFLKVSTKVHVETNRMRFHEL